MPPPYTTVNQFGLCKGVLSLVQVETAEAISRQSAVIADSDDSIAGFHTMPTFGCVLHETST